MRTYEFHLPDIGEGIAEAEIVGWHVEPGNFVYEDDALVDMMTDKATVEISAPVSGRIISTAGNVGDLIAIGSVLVTFEVEGEDGADSDGLVSSPAPELAPAEAIPEDMLLLAELPTAAEAKPLAAPQMSPNTDRAGRVHASPSVRKRAKDLGVNLLDVQPHTDRIRHSDLDAFLNYNAKRGFAPSAGAGVDEEVRVIGLRRRIAENMAASKRHIPHFSYVEELDVTRLEEVRAELNSGRADNPRLTILPLLIKAFCKALPEFPMMNARYDDEAGVVTRYGAVHLGVATQTDAGLMVPVVRNAQTLNLWQLAAEISRLSTAVRSGKALPEELSGSTLTVTSLGPLGGIATTPVINRPEVAILGPNRVIERPIFRNREVVAAKLMNLSISCDHRVVDGWDAASFVQRVKQLVEAPALLFAP